MKSFLCKVGLALLPLIVMAGFNLGVDSANLYRGAGMYQEVALELNSGNAITGLLNYDERQLQRAWAEGARARADVVVIGSSRTFTIDSQSFPGHSVRNHSVSGAVLEDFLGLTELYSDRSRCPDAYVLGVDPWIFNRNHGGHRHHSLRDAISRMRMRLRSDTGSEPESLLDWDIHRSKIRELFRPEYAQENWRALRADAGSFTVVTPDAEFADGPIRLPDGSLRYPSDYAVSDEMAARLFHFQLEDFCEVDPGILRSFTDLVEHLASRKRADTPVEVVLFLPSYRNDAYAQFESSAPSVYIVEERLTELAARFPNVTLAGSYDPAMSNLAISDFFDPIHARPGILTTQLRAAGIPDRLGSD
jgi:hypothetical protein